MKGGEKETYNKASCPLFHSPGTLATVPDGHWTDFTEKGRFYAFV